MTDTEIIIECAKLDGWQQMGPGECHWTKYFGQPIEQRTVESELPAYLTSRDAIIPVIEKTIITEQLAGKFMDAVKEFCDARDKTEEPEWKTWLWIMMLEPRQLCTALLKATGRYKE